VAARTYLFVYGSCKRGRHNHGVLAGQRFVAAARTEALYRLHDCGPYPCLVDAPEGGRPVLGEVYEVDAEALARLDELEGAPDYYRRGPVRLQDFTEPVEAYFFQQDAGRFPDCGDCWPPAGTAEGA
jgi:gamma-glutamylcyclotransferase (GGCT)/AIG2-like uncharacterized protein YtfP